MQQRWIAPLAALVLLWPHPADAQAWSALEAQRQRCAETGSAAVCRAALEQSHVLKRWADNAKLWRCTTALLGAEAVMLSSSFNPGTGTTLEGSNREVRQACGR
ncbi:MAG: hypothetical protein FJ056_02205 [Cyanobacteria bacterium M_surface_10_m2_179]|nr:hypothetical protein [Cyanobacteria bacterium M_surface_10_m2_179]